MPDLTTARRMLRVLAALAKSHLAREAFVNNLLKEMSYAHGLLRSLGHPRIFQLETTNHCPYTCIMCPRTHGMTRALGHMDIGLFRTIIDQLRPAWQVEGVRTPPLMRLFHFGEPMVYRYFVESVAHCHHRGLHVLISTNPSVWTERRIEEVLDVQLDRMCVMVDGMDDGTSMAIRGKVASFVRGVENIRTLAERKCRRGLKKPRITIAMIKQPRNSHHRDLFTKYWKEIEGIDAVEVAPFSIFAGDIAEINRLGSEMEGQDAEQAAWAERMRRQSALPCYYPWHSMSVTWDGKAVPCCRDHNAVKVLGDLTKDSLEDIWNGSRMQALRREFLQAKVSSAPCATCNERSLETGLPGSFYPIARLLR